MSSPRIYPKSETLFAERTRLVRLCASITHDIDAAEDLAQETLMEAWRHWDDLQDEAGLSPWLSAIARNICLRWGRARGRDQARRVELRLDTETATLDVVEHLADDFDFELELERQDLAVLLDQAMALLPSQTRTLLVDRYVKESPLQEIAARHGIEISVAAKRLQRGKLAFRNILTSHLRQAIAPYLLRPNTLEWEETNIWCPLCGKDRLKGKSTCYQYYDLVWLEFVCPTCPLRWATNMELAADNKNTHGLKPLLFNALAQLYAYIQPYIGGKIIPCSGCRRVVPLQICTPEIMHPQHRAALPNFMQNEHFLYTYCPACHSGICGPVDGFILFLPEGRRFWRKHPHLRALPKKDIEMNGRAAILAGFECVHVADRLDVIVARDTFEVLRIFGAPGEREQAV